ncbi:MAG: hypothetical protein LBN35_00800 [Clostridiales Family XIII bacterium]|jgi:hypothetical protein|nr:hypothetical protein [Clostridiales Family XIII bacterium]
MANRDIQENNGGRKINAKKRSAWGIFWGIMFVLGAGAVVASQFGLFGGVEIGVWTIIIAVVLLFCIISSLVSRFWFGVFIPLAGIAYLFRAPLGIDPELNWWVIGGAALLLSIGVTILFHRRPKRFGNGDFHKRDWHNCDSGENFEQVINTEDGSNVYAHTSFGSTIKYINSESMEQALLECSFGALKAYFDNAKVAKGGAEISLNLSFGAIEVYFPKDWRVIDNLQRSASSVEEKNRSVATENSPVVTLTGKASFSALTILYV